MKKSKISPAVIRRLPKYYRALTELSEIRISRISSKQLGKLTGFNPSQIRQDLNSFGGFGQQGYGYNVKNLKENMERILNIFTNKSMVLIGVGNLGKAILQYAEFSENGFHVRAAFDRDPNKIGTKIDGVRVRDIDDLAEYLKENKTDIAILTIHKDVAQRYATICTDHGVRGIWNFAPKKLKVPEEVIVENVWLNESLYTLSYFLEDEWEDETESEEKE
ncbi:MAG: redox-sensing transcriptional repressor Rex [Tissierellia bacterium]|nr:redox-sensing transcriptional repressor Rex [Tissierellia bacterium]